MIVPAGLSSSAAVAVALVVVSSLHLAVAAGQQPSFRGRDIAGSGGPCALAVAPLGYPCEEHQVLYLLPPLDLGTIVDPFRAADPGIHPEAGSEEQKGKKAFCACPDWL